MGIVSLELAKQHLRYDDDAEDDLLQGYIDAAESVIQDYITDEFENGYPKSVVQAALLLVGYFDQYRNAEKETPTNGNFLPLPVQALLYPYRKPTAV